MTAGALQTIPSRLERRTAAVRANPAVHVAKPRTPMGPLTKDFCQLRTLKTSPRRQ
jgi:hypothetical protein